MAFWFTDKKEVEIKVLHKHITHQLTKLKTALDTCDLTVQRNRDYIRTYFNNIKKLAALPQGQHMPMTMERITQQIEILEQEFNDIIVPNIKNNVVYAVIPAYDYEKDRDMDVIVFATMNQKKAYAIHHYLNNTLKEPVMLQWILQMAQETAQDTVQHYISAEKFRIIEYDKTKLEEYYHRVKSLDLGPLVYDFLSIEGMINQTETTKIEGSSVNDRFWDKDTLEDIRKTFDDEYIV